LATIAILPARSGSIRIKNKNIVDFCGKPIITYALEVAIKRRGLPLKSSETTQGIKDVTEESSKTAYPFTDLDLTVFKNTPAEDDGDKNNKYQKEFKMTLPKDTIFPSGKTLGQVEAELDQQGIV
jgi:hypothetical protein